MRDLEACPKLPRYFPCTAVLMVVSNKDGRFAKMIFYVLRADKYADFKVMIIGKKVNIGDGEGMQVPCLLKISGAKNMLQILCKSIQY